MGYLVLFVCRLITETVIYGYGNTNTDTNTDTDSYLSRSRVRSPTSRNRLASGIKDSAPVSLNALSPSAKSFRRRASRSLSVTLGFNVKSTNRYSVARSTRPLSGTTNTEGCTDIPVTSDGRTRSSSRASPRALATPRYARVTGMGGVPTREIIPGL